ncbi:response regulator [Altererythrobacter lutimaris]|uniref:Response regulator n=1 Tax=Altererythrobacter lutimaris TaxID=2743979 RepID=A0A850HE44_9SPHN|nr:response regulator [Altererythrobacter lutimaris]NVE95940.1 response regulator [Altererythrobacter lutimaris]
MSAKLTLLLLEDEPLILMDLELAAEDCGCDALPASNAKAALDLLEEHGDAIDAAILDVSLGAGQTCFPVAHQLQRMGIPYILHSGDLDRHNERIRTLQAERIAKPAPVEIVIATALEQIAPGERAST